MGMIYKESQPVTSWYCIAASHSMAYSEPNSFVLYYRTTTWMDYHIDVLLDYHTDVLRDYHTVTYQRRPVTIGSGELQ